jgi:hypothetical protein
VYIQITKHLTKVTTPPALASKIILHGKISRRLANSFRFLPANPTNKRDLPAVVLLADFGELHHTSRRLS